MEASDLNPVTATASAIEYVSAKPYKVPSVLPPLKQKKFEEMLKQDFFKDDPYKEMWDSNWIKK